MPAFIKDLFDLADVVRGGDFVLRLAEGQERPEQTLRDYVVTPQLAKRSDDALSLVRDALEGRTSIVSQRRRVSQSCPLGGREMG